MEWSWRGVYNSLQGMEAFARMARRTMGMAARLEIGSASRAGWRIGCACGNIELEGEFPAAGE
jgi:hypothetical protein